MRTLMTSYNFGILKIPLRNKIAHSAFLQVISIKFRSVNQSLLFKQANTKKIELQTIECQTKGSMYYKNPINLPSPHIYVKL